MYDADGLTSRLQQAVTQLLVRGTTLTRAHICVCVNLGLKDKLASLVIPVDAVAGQLHTPLQNQEAHRQLQHDDVVQKAVNSGMGFIVGDILAQRLTGEAFDAVRSLELGLYGTLLGMIPGTALHVELASGHCMFTSIHPELPQCPAQAYSLSLCLVAVQCPCKTSNSYSPSVVLFYFPFCQAAFLG